jgi:hypothetical protein
MQKLTITEQNLKFISLGSDPISTPKEFHFMRKYFKTKLQRSFFDYYSIFRSTENFTAHTGIKIGVPSLSKLSRKFEWLLEEYYTAKKEMNLDKLSKLKRRRVNLLKKFS